MLFKLSVIGFLHIFTTQHIFVSILRNNDREYLHKNSGRLRKVEKYLIFHCFLTWHNVITCDWCNLTNPVTIWNVTGNKGKLLSLSRLKRKKKKYLSWNIKTKALEYEQIICQHGVCSNILYLALLRYILLWILGQCHGF